MTLILSAHDDDGILGRRDNAHCFSVMADERRCSRRAADASERRAGAADARTIIRS